MRLLPVDVEQPSTWEDGLWVEHPGWPWYEGSWIHPPLEGQAVPEFEFEEGHDDTRNKAPPVLVIGSGSDVHIRLADERIPRRLCQLLKLGRYWWLEGLQMQHPVYFGDEVLVAGERVQLKDRDTFSLLRPPTLLSYRILINDDDNWYIDLGSSKEYPNKHRSMFPYRPAHCKECPDELKTLAWQTDQMRRRSEEDQVRVADWAAFSQYVKRHYLRYGIDCKPWVDEKRPHDEKPPSYPPKAYPGWIADIVKKERQLPGLSGDRPQAFGSSLAMGGVDVMQQMELKSAPPQLEERNSNPVTTDPAEAKKLGKGSTAKDETTTCSTSTCTSVNGGMPTANQEQQHDSICLAAARQAKQEEIKKWSFRKWLETIDESRYLLQYHDSIAENFDSIEQIFDIYFSNGAIQKAFFDDTGIRKLGHRRIFEKWFQENFGNSTS